ncbi:hypothetical protein K438DRAFT_1674666, partial [Mycena galopus ATCC 62051]
MPLFNHSSNVTITGGTFNEVGGDINIRLPQSMAVRTRDPLTGLECGPIQPQLSGPERNTRHDGSARLLPYDILRRPQFTHGLPRLPRWQLDNQSWAAAVADQQYTSASPLRLSESSSGPYAAYPAHGFDLYGVEGVPIHPSIDLPYGSQNMDLRTFHDTAPARDSSIELEGFFFGPQNANYRHFRNGLAPGDSAFELAEFIGRNTALVLEEAESAGALDLSNVLPLPGSNPLGAQRDQLRLPKSPLVTQDSARAPEKNRTILYLPSTAFQLEEFYLGSENTSHDHFRDATGPGRNSTIELAQFDLGRNTALVFQEPGPIGSWDPSDVLRVPSPDSTFLGAQPESRLLKPPLFPQDSELTPANNAISHPTIHPPSHAEPERWFYEVPQPGLFQQVELPWDHQDRPGINIHGGTFIGGNISYVQQSDWHPHSRLCDREQLLRQWIHRRKSDYLGSTPITGNWCPRNNATISESIHRNISLALALAEQTVDIAQVAPMIKPAVNLLSQIVQSFREDRGINPDEKRNIITEHLVNLTGDVSATVLQMEATDHSNLVERLKQDFVKFATLTEEASQLFHYHDAHSEFQFLLDNTHHKLELFGARFRANRLVHFHLNRPPDTKTLDKVYDVVVAEKFEKWLRSPPDMTEKQHETEKLRMEGTCQWFLEGNKFVEWEDNAGILWIQGSSGTGKTILSSAVIKELFGGKTQLAPWPPAVAFFYFDFRDREAQSVEIALRRIVLQLSAQSPYPYRTLDNQYRLSRGQKLPSYQDLCKMLRELLDELGRTYIILDALDECADGDSSRLVSLISELNAWTQTPLHLLITSQPRDIFTKRFKGLNCITLEVNVTQPDIEFFIANELQSNSNLQIWQPCAAQVAEQITRKSSGMFRLAACLLKELSRCLWLEDEELQKTLDRLPGDLFGIYDRFIQAIPEAYFPYAIAALRWTMFYCGSDWDHKFTLAELADAVAFDFSNPIQYSYTPSRREGNTLAIPKWLAGLIQFDGWSVTLAHSSVQDYLLSQHFQDIFGCDLSKTLSHTFISRTCISYSLYFSQHLLNKENFRSYPCIRYAGRYWYHHLLVSNDQNSLLHLALELLKDGSKQYHAWFQLMMDWDSVILPPLHFCCKEGYLECVSCLLETGTNCGLDLVYELGSPLAIASYWGHIKIIHLLLENGADIDAVGGEYGSALAAACDDGKLETVCLLLQHGANINLAGGEYGSALAAASFGGELEIVCHLLANGADVHIPGGDYGCALTAAAFAGHLKIVCLLLENGAHIDFAGGEYGSALAAASYRGHLDIHYILMGANINQLGGIYGTALAAASYEGKLEIVSLLLKNGPDVNLGGVEYGSPLAAGCYGGHLKIVRLLLQNGVYINFGGAEYGSPLAAASYRGSIKIVQLLLKKGADVNLTG